MKLHILSDIHLEFAPFEAPITEAEVVILAGDTHPGTKGVSWAMKSFPQAQVIYILGNHEYYGQALPRHVEKLKQLAEGSNVHVLEHDRFIYKDIIFLGCTLWADFELFGNPSLAGDYATQNMMDYQKIRVSPSYRRLRSIDTAGIHYRTVSWLADQNKKYQGCKTVIISHHAPSIRSIPEGDENEIQSAACASNLDKFVDQSGAYLWIHGHLHLPSDYRIGNTRVISNPRGYTGFQKTNFTPDLLMEV